MIKINNLDKYFNKGKSNSIHVINNTSLEFPNEGLVSLVGSSGSGKTTLLNVISGLDSAKGQIAFDDVIMNKYESSKWDKIRSHDIGYIFQNYYLLEDKSVYENIALTLNMIGIIDEEEVEYRTHYVLDAVGMYRFRNKKASDLSGGQKQRVAIARAIAKNPKVIIADEPTGNLDSSNSIAVMKIIKKISEERLVILVTHNMSLANKYSDRIVTLSDGSVLTDEENLLSSSTELSYDDKNIYLGNLNNYSSNDKIKLYSNAEELDIEVTIVKINNSYYLKPNGENVRINVIDNKSEIKLIDRKLEDIKENEAFETKFSLGELDKVKTKRVKKRTLSFKEALISTLRKIKNLGKKAKLQVVALAMLGMMFSVSVHGLASNIILDTSGIHVDEHVYMKGYNSDMFDPSVNYYQYTAIGDMNFIDSNRGYRGFSLESAIPVDVIKESQLTNGRMPKNDLEILIDETVLDKKYSASVYFNSRDIYEAKDLVNFDVSVQETRLKIVGTVKTNSKAAYISRTILSINKVYSIRDQSGSFARVYDGLNIVQGRLPLNTNFMANENIEMLILDGTGTIGETFTYTNHKDNTEFTYEVVGLVDNNDSSNVYYINPDVANELLNGEASKSMFYDFIYIVEGPSPDVNLRNLRQLRLQILKEDRADFMLQAVIQMTIAIVVSGLIFYFLVRSSLTSRVKEISILRSLGVSKYEVLSLFTVEYFILTLFTSFIGVVLGSILTNSLYNSFMGSMLGVRVTPISLLVAVVGIFLTNIILALIPLLLLLRKTPANMLTMYDI